MTHGEMKNVMEIEWTYSGNLDTDIDWLIGINSGCEWLMGWLVARWSIWMAIDIDLKLTGTSLE